MLKPNFVSDIQAIALSGLLIDESIFSKLNADYEWGKGFGRVGIIFEGLLQQIVATGMKVGMIVSSLARLMPMPVNPANKVSFCPLLNAYLQTVDLV